MERVRMREEEIKYVASACVFLSTLLIAFSLLLQSHREARIQREFRRKLGSRIVDIATGTAKISPVVLHTIRRIFRDITVSEYYGITGTSEHGKGVL